jgi:hypothetical protein
MTAWCSPPNLMWQIGHAPDTILHPIFMDARLLIVWHPTYIYQACVLAPGLARSWMKTYDSKLECITELRCIDLLTPSNADEVLTSDFDVKDHILIISTATDAGTLLD